MRYELERVDVWPAVKIGFFLGAVLGFLVGALWAGVLMLVSGLASMVVPEDVGRGLFAIPAAAGIMIPIVMTLFQGIVWAFLAAVGTLIYNVLSGWVGGLVLRLTPLDANPRQEENRSLHVGSG